MRKTARLKNSGFTLVEVVVVAALIGVIALLVVPNFINANEKVKEDICLDNMKQIHLAKRMWALENGEDDSTQVTMTVLMNGRYLKEWPVCPLGGTYSTVAGEAVSAMPSCSIHGSASGGDAEEDEDLY